MKKIITIFVVMLVFATMGLVLVACDNISITSDQIAGDLIGNTTPSATDSDVSSPQDNAGTIDHSDPEPERQDDGSQSNEPAAPSAPVTYVVSTTKNVDSAGEVSGGGSYQVGETVTLRATVNAGYAWLGWYDGENKVSEGDRLEYTFTMPAENKVYIAKWSETTTTTEETYLREGNYIYFGSYPQSEVKDSEITSALNAAAGELPTRTDFHDWTSYGYYVASEQIDSIFYIDLTYQDIKYRGVCLTGYRPSLTTDTALPAKTHQYENGYLPGSTVYWFRYEPIKWRILEESEGSALLICDMILDSQAFQNTSTRSEAGKSVVFTNDNPDTPDDIYGNNYRYSTIRAWLNEDFCQTAFTALQKGLILLTTVDNDGTSAQPTDTAWNNSSTTYLCEDTEDYIFLPSEAEITDPDYGFPGYFAEFDDAAARKRLPTDYAVSQGLDKYDGGYESVVGYGPYWLRSPRSNSSGEACKVIAAGSCHSGDIVLNTGLGVVPMLRISLS